MPLSVTDFVKRWKIASLSERSGSQTHFIDLCDMLGQPHPAAADSTGERYTFDKPLTKTSGAPGFADVWLRDHFAWEYKGKHKNLDAAYKQLNDYREDLDNPPLLVVCDMNRFEVHTNFTSTSKRTYIFDLSDLERNQPIATCPLPPLEVLRALFGDTSALRPNRTDAFVTQEAAKVFARLAERLEIEKRSLTDTPIHTKEEIAHFLMRLLFCLFADSIDLLPKRVFRNLIQSDDRFLPRKFLRKLRNLFEAMSEPDGIFGEHTIKYFNGGLFDSASIIELDTADLAILHEATRYNWAHVAPEIFGTLFERSLNAERRSLIGAHYTSAEDILLLIEPVLMRPLERRWAEVQSNILTVLGINTTANTVILSEDSQPRRESQSKDPEGLALATTSGAIQPRTQDSQSLLRSNPEAERLLSAWLDELTAVRVLDPACGSGNFLYLALRRLLDLWLEAQRFAAEHDISLVLPRMVSPTQLYGIETEFYAHELASIVVWIGFLQWKHEHGIIDAREPILQKLDNIQHADAILRYDENGEPYEPSWPPANFVVGNPPFLTGSKLRRELGHSYVESLFALYENRVSGAADLVTYWFERARKELEVGNLDRVGFIATQGVRGGASQKVLSRVAETGSIFMAWSDRDWPLDGATVHVSFVAFDDGSEESCKLNGVSVPHINPDLTSNEDTTTAFRLEENFKLWAYGSQSKGSFDISNEVARKLLASLSPFGLDYRSVIKQSFNGKQLLDGTSRWVIDFGETMSETDAALYEAPFEYVKKVVKPEREGRREVRQQRFWWLHARPSPKYRMILSSQERYIATAATSKHRVFVWLTPEVLVDHAIIVFARQDDYFFGVLQSSAHEVWSRIKGTQVREAESGFRYTPSTTFDTFPFPYPPGTEPSETDSPIVRAIADAARELVRLRDAWLNPPNASEADLKDRTLTKLYNARPEWLANAHRALDHAVFAAYGWPSNLSDQEILARLLALNHERAGIQS